MDEQNGLSKPKYREDDYHREQREKREQLESRMDTLEEWTRVHVEALEGWIRGTESKTGINEKPKRGRPPKDKEKSDVTIT